MEASEDPSTREAAASQLSYLDQWEAAYTGENVELPLPQQIVELRIIRPYLESVASGSELWDADRVGRLINESLLAAMQPPFVAEATESWDTTAATAASPTCSPSAESAAKVGGTSNESVVKVERQLGFGDRIAKISQSKLAKYTNNAWEFLQNGSRAKMTQPDKSENKLCCHSDHSEEDLISFENDPVVGPADIKPINITIPHDTFTDDKVDVKDEPVDACLIVDQCTSLKIEDDHAGVASTHLLEEAVKCFTCGTTPSAEALVMCPCQHQYCHGCLCHMVKSSIRGEIPFPPMCCESPVPIDVNTSVFDQNTLCDFFSRKFGISYMNPDASPRKRKAIGAPSQDKAPSQVHGVTVRMSRNGVQESCYLCRRVNEKDSFCPDCCYRCNRSRASCKCAWWEERQRRMEAQKAINDNTFNPNAPALCPTDGSDKCRKMPLNGIFRGRRDSALFVGEPPRTDWGGDLSVHASSHAIHGYVLSAVTRSVGSVRGRGEYEFCNT
ncbi:unnamed protein product [Fusarium graminearum]|uniref:RING-type domain-containing protein n=1 Tax=Gibberella zeae TaxID=5518 RepID=A0A9N8NFA1_GIBZA|nr:unnamed protein product [Fusarium graminearum]